MASFKESQLTRPQSSHRLSMGPATTSAMPTRHATSRHHSHSVSLGAANPSHRVTRRKSINASAVNSAAAVAAALHEQAPGFTKRRSFNLKNMGNSRGSESSKHAGVNNEQNSANEVFESNANFHVDGDSAVGDEFLSTENAASISKPKARRASEGAQLTKGEGKRSNGELRCEKCGKGYKHSSCLTKHLWEHTPEWSYTSKLLISKHQQVQLLEAASVLVGMNQDEPSGMEDIKAGDSDESSASPTASGSSDIREDEDEDEIYTSAETTPPPMSEFYGFADGMDAAQRKRYSGNSSSFSRSYQSAPSTSLPPNSAFGYYDQQRRPSTSGPFSTASNEEEASLAAAVETLCTFGTPRNGPVLLPADVPPVPPLPARYVEENVNRLSNQLGPLPEVGLPNPSYQRLSNERGVKDFDEQRDEDDKDDRSISQGRSDEDDEFFGAMEGISHEPAPRVH